MDIYVSTTVTGYRYVTNYIPSWILGDLTVSTALSHPLHTLRAFTTLSQPLMAFLQPLVVLSWPLIGLSQLLLALSWPLLALSCILLQSPGPATKSKPLWDFHDLYWHFKHHFTPSTSTLMAYTVQAPSKSSSSPFVVCTSHLMNLDLTSTITGPVQIFSHPLQELSRPLHNFNDLFKHFWSLRAFFRILQALSVIYEHATHTSLTRLSSLGVTEVNPDTPSLQNTPSTSKTILWTLWLSKAISQSLHLSLDLWNDISAYKYILRPSTSKITASTAHSQPLKALSRHL